MVDVFSMVMIPSSILCFYSTKSESYDITAVALLASRAGNILYQ